MEYNFTYEKKKNLNDAMRAFACEAGSCIDSISWLETLLWILKKIKIYMIILRKVEGYKHSSLHKILSRRSLAMVSNSFPIIQPLGCP